MPDINNVEIFAVGTWNNFKFVQEDLKQIVDNTNKLMERKTHHVPIKLGHSEEQILKGQSDGDPALGSVNGFAIKGDKITATLGNMPDILFSSIGKARFTNVSIEMDHIKQFGWFITAVALLGADLPAVKTLDDLQAFLSDEMNIDSSNDNVQQLSFSEPRLLNKPKFKEVKKMSDNEKTDTSAIDALTKRLDTLEKENAAYKDKEVADKSKFSEQETELLKFKEKETARQFSEKKESVLKVYKEDAKAGKVKPAIVDAIEKHLDSQESKFTEDSELTLSADLSRAIGQAYSEQLDKKEHSSDESAEDGVTPDVAITQAIADVRAKTGMSYIEAEERVFEAQPQLYADYNKWTENISYGRAN